MELVLEAPVPGFPWYKVSTTGVVTNVLTQHALACTVPKRYPTVTLSRAVNGKEVRSGHFVHRLVAAAFVPNPNPDTKKCVNHLDGNTHNFNASNLEWCTPPENQKHAVRTGLRSGKRKGIHVQALSVDTGEVVAEYVSMGEAARACGLSGSSGISYALAKPQLSSGGYRWRRAPTDDPPDNPCEEWRVVPDIDGVVLSYIPYSVSTLGRVRNERTKQLMTQHPHAGGYSFVSLSVARSKAKSLLTHRLVARAFLPEPPGKCEVNHRDRNKRNNQHQNLEWLTQPEHAKVTHSIPVIQKTFDGVEVARYACYQDAADAVGRSKQSIFLAVHGKTSHCAGFHWEFVRSHQASNVSNVSDVKIQSPRIDWDATQTPSAEALSDDDIDQILHDVFAPALTDDDIARLLREVLGSQ